MYYADYAIDSYTDSLCNTDYAILIYSCGEVVLRSYVAFVCAAFVRALVRVVFAHVLPVTSLLPELFSLTLPPELWCLLHSVTNLSTAHHHPLH